MERRVLEMAATQHGLMTRAQARAKGLSDDQIDWRLARGLWTRILPGVFRITGAPATGRQGMLAATLWAGRRSVLSHRAAGVLWGLDGVGASRLEVTIERPRRLQHELVTVHRTRELLRIDRAVEDGIRVTAVARTLFDLAGVLTAQDLELAFEDALRRQLTSVARIRHRLDALGGRGVQGCSALRELVGAQRPGHRASGSKPEVGLRRLLVTTGYKPVSQFRVHRQGFEAFLDLAYPAVKLGIEYDGGPAHAGSLARARDRRRDHALAALGWRVVHVTKDELRNGAPTVLATVRAAFAASGS